MPAVECGYYGTRGNLVLLFVHLILFSLLLFVLMVTTTGLLKCLIPVVWLFQLGCGQSDKDALRNHGKEAHKWLELPLVDDMDEMIEGMVTIFKIGTDDIRSAAAGFLREGKDVLDVEQELYGFTFRCIKDFLFCNILCYIIC